MWPFKKRSKYSLIRDGFNWAIYREPVLIFGARLFDLKSPGFWWHPTKDMYVSDCWTSDREKAEMWLKRLQAVE